MNANELAEGINSPHNACCYRDKCRQQQAEIEALKSDNDKLTEALLKDCRVYDFDNPLLDKAQEK